MWRHALDTRPIAQVRYNLSADAQVVKGESTSPAKSNQHKEFAERLSAAMAAQKGWKGRGAATLLAKAVGAAPALAASWLRGERIPRSPYYGRILSTLGISAEALQAPENGPGMAQVERSAVTPYRDTRPSERHTPAVVSESVREAGRATTTLTVAEEWDRLAKSVAARWHSIIVKHRIPFGDLIDLLRAEVEFLRARGKGRGAAGAHLMAAADDTEDLIESLTQMQEPR